MTGLPRSSSRGSAYAAATATADNECKYEHLMKSVVQNPIGAHRGQHVMIETPTKGVVKGALAIYVLPLVMLIWAMS